MCDTEFGKGCLEDPRDKRDRPYEELMGYFEVDWKEGYDVEKDLSIKIPIKNQGSSGSCVGQGVSYYVGVLNSAEVGKYDEVSAKAVYSQIELGSPSGGAYIRDGMKLIKEWGSVKEPIVPSYEILKFKNLDGSYRIVKNPPIEKFMKDKSWKTPEMDKLAEILQAKEYRVIEAKTNMDLFAHAILNSKGVVGGVRGANNGTWGSLEPKPPVKVGWGHCIYFGKFGIDRLGKWISTPNSWDKHNPDDLHPDGWQKLREDYFESGNMFNPWTLTDKLNKKPMTKLVKTKDRSTVYIVSYDNKYYPIAYEKFALDLFGESWNKIDVEVVDSIPQDRIAYPVGGYVKK